MTTSPEAARCVQWVATDRGVRQCARRATHYLPDHPATKTCGQHARSYDVPLAASR